MLPRSSWHWTKVTTGLYSWIILHRWPFAPLCFAFFKYADVPVQVFFFSRLSRTFSPRWKHSCSTFSFSPSCGRRDVAAAWPAFLPTDGFSDTPGLIIESEYSCREDASHNQKVTWNKSSLAISVSLITLRQVPRGRNAASFWSCESRASPTPRDLGPYQLN